MFGIYGIFGNLVHCVEIKDDDKKGLALKMGRGGGNRVYITYVSGALNNIMLCNTVR